MRPLGYFLLGTGAIVGGAVGVAMLAGWSPAGASWLAGVALAKLTLVASAGLMGAGGICLRLHNRRSSSKQIRSS